MQRDEVIADAIGLSVLAGGVGVGLGVISHRIANPSGVRVWYALPLEFLISYSVLSLSAIYLWRNHRALRNAIHWLAFTALSSILLLVGTNYIRVAGGAGIFLGVASVARSLVLQARKARLVFNSTGRR